LFLSARPAEHLVEQGYDKSRSETRCRCIASLQIAAENGNLALRTIKNPPFRRIFNGGSDGR